MTTKDPFSRFFDTDVSIRIQGDRQDAFALMPQAQNLLRRATLFREAGQPVVKLWSELPDGSLLMAYLHGPVKQLYIQPALRKGVVDVEGVEQPSLISTACPDMLSGVVYPGSAVLLPKGNEDDPDLYSAHEFHPTQASADIYQLNFAWQDVERLGVASDPKISTATLQVRWPKPSMYSGAMKRVVQALYGIGKTEDTVDDKIVGAEGLNQYDYRWSRTDGIHRVGNTVLLVRISKDDGVLVMPLPLFECTTSDAFKEALADIGDTGAVSIIDEFGGLPSGDTFPEGEALETAIANGSVLRLLTASDIGAFFQYSGNLFGGNPITKNPYFNGCGWAFSESGSATSAHNTCWWYSRPDIVALPFQTWATDGFANADPLDRYMRAEHWKITFNLSVSPEGKIDGTAALELVEVQPLEAPNSTWLVDLDAGDPLFPPQCGHPPVTGKVGRSGIDGQTTHDTGYLYASGMDWTRFSQNFTPLIRSGAPSAIQADYLSHSAFMAVPRNDGSDRLDRFKFWGRSQSGIHIVDMEPAYEAPVLVFYAGEALEIVRRKADRYQSDRETVAAQDVVPGTYYPGDFFGTSLNLLTPIRTAVTTTPGNVALQPIPGYYRGPPQFAHVGLIIPVGCREGYVFVKAEYDGSKNNDIGAETISYHGFAPALGGAFLLNEYVSDYNDRYTVPNFGTFTIGKYELSVLPAWWSHWTNTYFDWNLGVTQTGVRLAISSSAFSEKVARHAEPQLGWRLLDVPFTYRLALPAPTGVSLEGLPAEFLYVLPDGIALSQAKPTEVTFVGAV